MANNKPKPRLTAIGDKNAVWPVAKKISGEIPRKVVILVSNIGRIRTRPATTGARLHSRTRQDAAALPCRLQHRQVDTRRRLERNRRRRVDHRAARRIVPPYHPLQGAEVPGLQPRALDLPLRRRSAAGVRRHRSRNAKASSLRLLPVARRQWQRTARVGGVPRSSPGTARPSHTLLGRLLAGRPHHAGIG